MKPLEIHAYNVGFGDAILVRIPRSRPTNTRPFRDILVDCGNSLTGGGGRDDILHSAMRDIHDKTAGRLDMYIMTHEHMDHVQGPLLLKRKDDLEFKAKKVWMTASAHPDYYETHENAKKRLQLSREFLEFAGGIDFSSLGKDAEQLSTILAINNPRKTADCVELIREHIALNEDAVHFIHADLPPQVIKSFTPFKEARIEVLAPEEDTSSYYGNMRHLSVAGTLLAPGGQRQFPPRPQPPAGVSLSEFNQLVEARDNGLASNALMIDKAANNSSIVFLLTWKTKKLLFAADAEEKSWSLMKERDLLEPVDFLKVSHHGSHNGTPDNVFEMVLAGRNGRQPVTLVSTAPGQYNGVPLNSLLERLKGISTLHDTRNAAPGEAIVVEISP